MTESPLLTLIKENAKKTDNKCGLTAVKLSGLSGLSFNETKTALNQLYVQGLIQVRDGAQGKLIMLK